MSGASQRETGGESNNPLPVHSPNRIIDIDPREGSRDLAAPLRALGLTVELRQMEYGDVAFTGHGPHGPCRVGIEYKTLSDLLGSMRTGRLAGHQLPGMAKHYQYVFLLIRGTWREGANGMVEEPVRGGWREVRLGTTTYDYRELSGFINTLEILCGVRVRRCGNNGEVYSAIKSLYNWFGKPWEDHGSHQTLFTAPNPGAAFLYKPSLLRRVAKELPGVGWERSADIAKHFNSVVDLCCAGAKELEQVPGIGRGIARKIVAALNGIREDQ